MAEQSNNAEKKDEELVGAGSGGRKLAADAKNTIRVDIEMNFRAVMAREFVCYVSSGPVIEMDKPVIADKRFTVDKMFDGNDNTHWASYRKDEPYSVTIVFTKGAVNVKSIA
eukprot:252023_1